MQLCTTKAYLMVKACKHVSTAMKARGVARNPIPAPVRANKTKKGGEDFAIWRSESNSL
ncbi:putative Replication factor c subunit [Daphnia magna]|uniref:Putative Replication factor c subunit n=1 Tax=Daphnia magna TaxID=35525 RepID=A0A162QAF5_9CRUS|nr:putative Replication factor c subunit [Daphnia magna]